MWVWLKIVKIRKEGPKARLKTTAPMDPSLLREGRWVRRKTL